MLILLGKDLKFMWEQLMSVPDIKKEKNLYCGDKGPA